MDTGLHQLRRTLAWHPARAAGVESAMHKPKPYQCPICGAEIQDQPMRVLQHQLSHVRRPLARNQPEPCQSDQPEERKPAEN